MGVMFFGIGLRTRRGVIAGSLKMRDISSLRLVGDGGRAVVEHGGVMIRWLTTVLVLLNMAYMGSITMGFQWVGRHSWRFGVVYELRKKHENKISALHAVSSLPFLVAEEADLSTDET